MGHICRWVDFTVAGFERPIRCAHDATGVGSPIQGGLGLLTYWTLASTATTHIARQVHHPCLPKVIDVVRFSAIRKYEVIAAVLVVVAAKTAHLTLVCGGHDHLNIIDSVVQDCQSKICPHNYVATLLGDPETPIIQGERKI